MGELTMVEPLPRRPDRPAALEAYAADIASFIQQHPVLGKHCAPDELLQPRGQLLRAQPHILVPQLSPGVPRRLLLRPHRVERPIRQFRHTVVLTLPNPKPPQQRPLIPFADFREAVRRTCIKAFQCPVEIVPGNATFVPVQRCRPVLPFGAHQPKIRPIVFRKAPFRPVADEAGHQQPFSVHHRPSQGDIKILPLSLMRLRPRHGAYLSADLHARAPSEKVVQVDAPAAALRRRIRPSRLQAYGLPLCGGSVLSKNFFSVV